MVTSSTPTLAHSSIPSVFPSLSFCIIIEFIGREYFLKVATLDPCLKIEMYVGGKLYIDSDRTNTACTQASTSDSLLVPMSQFNGTS